MDKDQDERDQSTPDENGSIWGRAKEGLGKAIDAGASLVSGVAEHASNAGELIATKTGLDRAVEFIDDQLDDRGVKKAVGSAVDAVSDRFDQVTGKQLVELLEERLRIQDEYNDVLASRLADALERIAAIEKRLSK